MTTKVFVSYKMFARSKYLTRIENAAMCKLKNTLVLCIPKHERLQHQWGCAECMLGCAACMLGCAACMLGCAECMMGCEDGGVW